MALDPALYADYELTVSHTLRGSTIRWLRPPAAELARILPIIRDSVPMLLKSFDVNLEVARDGSHAYLTLLHRDTPTPACLRDIKGRCAAIEIATSWGGSG